MSPFVSKSQRAFLYAKHPEIAKRWEKETPKNARLPQHKNAMKKALKIEKAVHKKMKGESLATDKAQFKFPQHRTIARGISLKKKRAV